MIDVILSSDSDKPCGLSRYTIFNMLQSNNKLSPSCPGLIDGRRLSLKDDLTCCKCCMEKLKRNER